MMSCRRTTASLPPTAQIEFLSEVSYDYSDVGADDTVKHWFVYRNTGSVPFIINKVETQCGCTSARFSKEPLAPGDTDSILITLVQKGLVSGYLYKNCWIYSNVDSVYRLTMQGMHVIR